MIPTGKSIPCTLDESMLRTPTSLRLRPLSLLGLLMLAALPGIGAAKGCLKGAAVGGVAGHVAGHHAVAGAAIGCAVGHHRAKKQQKAAEQQQQQAAAQAQKQPAPAPQNNGAPAADPHAPPP
jgi:hypothetical protein